MKATVFYDTKGDIQSVVYIHPEAHTTPKGGRTKPRGAHHASIEIEVEDVSPDKLAELHSKHRVDIPSRKLVRR